MANTADFRSIRCGRTRRGIMAWAEPIPEGRGKKDKEAYLYMRWWLRKNKVRLKKHLEKKYREYVLYGSVEL